MKDLTQGNIYKTYLLFAIPLMLAGLLSQAYSIVDTMIAGRFLGEAGLGAIGATADLINLASSAFWGINAGLGMFFAMLFGGKQFARLKGSIISTAIVVFLCMFTICVLLILFRNPIFNFLEVAPSLRPEAEKYFIVYILGLCLIVFNDFGLCALNALGMSGYPFKMSLLSMALNIGGNILAVTVLDMGVLGIALASVFAAVIVDVCYVFKLVSVFREVREESQGAKISFIHVKDSFAYSLPAGAQQMVLYIASFFILPIINGTGAAATAAYVVIMRIYSVVASVYQNSSKTVSNYVAQSIGAGKRHLLPRGLRVGFLQSLLFATPFVLFFAIAPRFFGGIFFPTGFSGEALDIAVTFARVCLPFILFNVVNNLFHCFFRGMAAGGLLLLSTAVGTVSRLSITYLFASRGMTAVFIGWIGSWIIEAAFCVLLYRFKLRKQYTKT